VFVAKKLNACRKCRLEMCPRVMFTGFHLLRAIMDSRLLSIVAHPLGAEVDVHGVLRNHGWKAERCAGKETLCGVERAG
jgi:hypothetical protein